jgi:hypothetical protein
MQYLAPYDYQLGFKIKVDGIINVPQKLQVSFAFRPHLRIVVKRIACSALSKWFNTSILRGSGRTANPTPVKLRALPSCTTGISPSVRRCVSLQLL